MPVPVYLFTGFLESGKTSLIKETFMDEGFYEGEKTVLVICEDGVEKYEESFVKEYNMYVVTCDKKEALNDVLFDKIEYFYHPDRVMIEYNGTWSVTDLLNVQLPHNWVYAQIIATVDASTFSLYMNAMRSVMYEQLLHAELIICNRCDETTKKSMLRGNIKAINKAAQIVYEHRDGTVSTAQEEPLPFSIDSDYLEISDDDYGLWYIDFMDKPELYDGKTIKVKGEVLRLGDVGANAFVLGRFAMVCCADDTSMVALLCEGKQAKELKLNDWVEVTAYVHVERDSNGDLMPVLAVKEIQKVEALEDPLVYFN